MYYGATQRTFKLKLEKIKENPARKNFLYFRKWNFLAPRLNFSYIAGSGTLLYFRKQLTKIKKKKQKKKESTFKPKLEKIKKLYSNNSSYILLYFGK